MQHPLEHGQQIFSATVAGKLQQLEVVQASAETPASRRLAENEFLQTLRLERDFAALLAVAQKILEWRPLSPPQFKHLVMLPALCGNMQAYAQLAECLQKRSEPECQEYTALFSLLAQALADWKDDTPGPSLTPAWIAENLEIFSRLLAHLRKHGQLALASRLSKRIAPLLGEKVLRNGKLQVVGGASSAAGEAVFSEGRRDLHVELTALCVRQGYFDEAVKRAEANVSSIWPIQRRWPTRKALAEELIRASAFRAASRLLEAHAQECEQAGLVKPPHLEGMQWQIEQERASGRPEAVGAARKIVSGDALTRGNGRHFRFSDEYCVVWLTGDPARPDSRTSTRQSPFILDSFQQAGVSLLRIVCLNPYQGLFGFDKQLADRKQAQAELQELLSGYGYRRFAFMGLSLCGASAILYAHEMGADGVLAFSPQTVNPPDSQLFAAAKTWSNTIRDASLSLPNDLIPMMLSKPLPAHVYYDQANEFDASQAERLRAVPSARLFQEQHNTHNVMLAKSIDGSLVETIKAFASAMRWQAN